MKPIILINFKNYKEAMGEKAHELAREISRVRKKKYTIVIAPSLLTVKEIASKVRIPVVAQHLDPITNGAYTGSISVAEAKKIGLKGTILNHSERKIPLKILKQTVELCRKSRLKTVVCASSLSEIKKVARLHPNYIAYEPRELIGTNISVTEAKPKIITKAVDLVKKVSPKTHLLCGAGIHSKEDIGYALLLGAKGVLIGHAVPKAKDPQEFLRKMLIT